MSGQWIRLRQRLFKTGPTSITSRWICRRLPSRGLPAIPGPRGRQTRADTIPLHSPFALVDAGSFKAVDGQSDRAGIW